MVAERQSHCLSFRFLVDLKNRVSVNSPAEGAGGAKLFIVFTIEEIFTLAPTFHDFFAFRTCNGTYETRLRFGLGAAKIFAVLTFHMPRVSFWNFIHSIVFLCRTKSLIHLLKFVNSPSLQSLRKTGLSRPSHPITSMGLPSSVVGEQRRLPALSI